MFKRLVIIWTVVHLVLLGGIPVGAHTEGIPESEIVNVQEENQQISGVVEQNQQIDTDDHSDDTIQDQEVTVNQEQTISDPNKEEHNENTQTDSIKLEQSVDVQVEQSQSAENAEKVDAVQEQESSIEYGQSLNLREDDQQGQETVIETDQSQSFKTDNQTDFVEQKMTAEIETYQKDEVDPKENQTNASQGTNIKTNLEHQSETSDHATINQKQSVEATADIIDTEGTETKEVNIKAITENSLQIIKEVSHYVIKIFQSIVVNEENIDTYEAEFIIDDHQQPLHKSQEYKKEFDWGVLSILNRVTVNSSEDHDLQSALSSIIAFNYFIEQNKYQNDHEQPEEEEPEIPGEENTDEEEPVIPDEEKPDEEEPVIPDEEKPDEEEPVIPDEEKPDEEEPVIPDEEKPDEEEPDIPSEEKPDEEKPSIPGEENPDEEEPVIPGEENPDEEKPSIPGEENTDEEEPSIPGEENTDEEEPGIPGEVSPGNDSPNPSPNEKDGFTEKPIPLFLDIDRDGVPNHLEISKFKTDPFKEDTDDDGLSDWFEITYHSASSFYFSFECMEYDWKDFVSPSEGKIQSKGKEQWKEIRLSPLSNDADGNGISDHLEDFDGDGVLNFEEQLQGTNPYIHNENKHYIGPKGTDLIKIIEKANRDC